MATKFSIYSCSLNLSLYNVQKDPEKNRFRVQEIVKSVISG